MLLSWLLFCYSQPEVISIFLIALTLVRNLMLHRSPVCHSSSGLYSEQDQISATLSQNGCEAAGGRGGAHGGDICAFITSEAHQSGGEMLLSFNGQQRPTGLHPRTQVHPHAQLPLPSDCQAEVKQRSVCEPRGPVAAAVPEERYQQDEEIQTGQLKTPAEIFLGHHSFETCDLRSSGMLYSTYGCHACGLSHGNNLQLFTMDTNPSSPSPLLPLIEIVDVISAKCNYI